MASLVKCGLFSFLLVLLFSARIQARESRFFSKFMHFGTADVDTFKESISEEPIGAPAPAPVVTEAESGYGLYGAGSSMMPPAKEITATNDENELLNEELDGVTFEKSYQNRNYDNNGYANNNNNGYQLATENYEMGNQNNNGYTTASNYNNDGYTTSNYHNNGYELASESYETGTQNKKNGYYNNNVNYYTNSNNNNNNNGYEIDRQGMSDTRFVEDGKHYYDVKNEKYFPTTEKLSTQNQGYYGDSNTEYSNKFNTMEFENLDEYEESQEQEP